MQETSEISEIVEQLESGGFSLIGIDGIDGSGKSTIAAHLASQLGFVHINLDDYVEENRGQFVSHIKYDEVRSQINSAQKPVILEGDCLLAVFDRLSRHPDFLIYIKRMSEYGSWRNEDDCDIDGIVDEYIARKQQELLKFGKAEASIEGREFKPSEYNFPALTEEIIRYHHEFRPYRNADVIFKRVD